MDDVYPMPPDGLEEFPWDNKEDVDRVLGQEARLKYHFNALSPQSFCQLSACAHDDWLMALFSVSENKTDDRARKNTFSFKYEEISNTPRSTPPMDMEGIT